MLAIQFPKQPCSSKLTFAQVLLAKLRAVEAQLEAQEVNASLKAIKLEVQEESRREDAKIAGMRILPLPFFMQNAVPGKSLLDNINNSEEV